MQHLRGRVQREEESPCNVQFLWVYLLSKLHPIEEATPPTFKGRQRQAIQHLPEMRHKVPQPSTWPRTSISNLIELRIEPHPSLTSHVQNLPITLISAVIMPAIPITPNKIEAIIRKEQVQDIPTS